MPGCDPMPADPWALAPPLQLVAYPQERILVYEVTPEVAREARWPVPVLSGFGFFRRKLQGEWRGATPLGRFLAESCSVIFKGLAGPAVVRGGATFDVDATGPAPMDRGVLVPVPAPVRRRARDEAGKGKQEGRDGALRAADAMIFVAEAMLAHHPCRVQRQGGPGHASRGFSATLGYPGEGPARPRLGIDIRTFRDLTPAVAGRQAAV